MTPSLQTPPLPAPIQRAEVRGLLPSLDDQIDLAELVGFDPGPERVLGLDSDVHAAETPRDAVGGADVVVTAGPIVDDPSSPLTPDGLGNGPWLLVPIDFKEGADS